MASYGVSRPNFARSRVGHACATGGLVKRVIALFLLVVALPGLAVAQLTPGNHHLMAHIGPFLPRSELLRTGSIRQTGRITDPTNPVITDIKVDPGLFVGARYVYALNQRLAVEAEFDFGLALCAIREIEIKDDAEEGDQPQYDTTTMDARNYQFSVNLVYFLGNWARANPFLTVGIGDHNLDLRRKGQVDPDPVHDRMFMAGLGTILHATERLGIRIELRNFMYNFRFDNQFVDPVQSQRILFRRGGDFIKATGVAGEKFQNDIALTLGFMVHPF